MHWLLASALFAIGVGPIGTDAAHEPQLAVRGSEVMLAFGAGHSLYFSRSRDAGKNFSAPVKVADAGTLLLTHHRGPRIAVTGSTLVITAVLNKNAGDGDLMAWRSTDNGRTWSKGVMINDQPDSAGEALHALAAAPDGSLFAAWLDKRGKRTLYSSRSTDGGRTWSKNTLVYASPDGNICECCHPSAAIDANGDVLVMWRNWLNGSRDLYLSRSADASTFSAPAKLGEGTWKLNGCPMDGGGIVATTSGVVTAWRREHSIFLDRPGEPEREIGQGTDVSLAAGKAGVYAIYTTPDTLQLLAPGAATPRPLGIKGAFPTVAALPAGGAVIAWEQDGRIEVKVIQ